MCSLSRLFFLSCSLASVKSFTVPLATVKKSQRAIRPLLFAQESQKNDAEAMLAQAEKLRAEIAALSETSSEEKRKVPEINIEALEAKFKSERVNAAFLDSAKIEWPDMRWKSATFDDGKGSSWTESRLRALTKISGADILGTGSEVSTDDLTKLTAAVFFLSGIGAIFANKLIGGNVGALASYLFAIIPIIFLAIGSSAPQLITGLLASTDEKLKDEKRRLCHESAHLAAGYAIGLEIQDFSAGALAPRVEFKDTILTNRKRPREQVESLAVVALAGAVAEAKRFGSAKGALDDLRTLQRLVDVADPPYISNEEQQQLARRAAVRAAYLLDLDGLARRPPDVGSFPSLGGPNVLAAIENAMADPNTDLPTILTVLEKSAAAANADTK